MDLPVDNLKYRPAYTRDQDDERLEAQEGPALAPRATDDFAGPLVETLLMKSWWRHFAGFLAVVFETMILPRGKRSSAKTDLWQKPYWDPLAKMQEPLEKLLPGGY